MKRKQGKAPSGSQGSAGDSAPQQSRALVPMQPDVIPSWESHGCRIADPPVPRPEGRQAALTQQVADRLIYAARKGVSRQAQARFGGINLYTLYDWLRLGRAGDERYAGFARAMDDREFDCEALAANSLLEQAKTNPIAAIGYLERRFPERWGLRHQVEVKVKGEIESMLAYLREQISPAAFEEVIRALTTYAGDSGNATAVSAESDIIEADFRDVG